MLLQLQQKNLQALSTQCFFEVTGYYCVERQFYSQFLLESRLVQLKDTHRDWKI
jgi:hypothetical protein